MTRSLHPPPPLLRLALLAGLLLLAMALALALGSLPLSLAELWAVLHGQGSPLAHSIVFELRLPRMLQAMLVGGLLSLAGWQMQLLLRNPLADPYILGISSGAALAGLLGLLLGVSGLWLNLWSGLGAGASLLLLLLLAGRSSSERLLLTGVMLSSLCVSGVSLILSLAPGERLRGMLFWLMGDLSQPVPYWPLLLILLVSAIISAVLHLPLAILSQGETLAYSLGVAIRPLRLLLLLLASLLTASAVMTAGSIGFIGMAVPHLARLLCGTALPAQLAGSLLLGPTLLLLADTASRTLFAPLQIPVGVCTALFGAPVFLWLLYRHGTTAR